MSFFDPANMFGGGGSRVRDPLGLFGGGRRQMSPQEIAQARGGGGQSIRDGGRREMAFGGAAGPAGGQFEREFADRPQPDSGFSSNLGNMRARMGGGQADWGGLTGGMGAIAQQAGGPTWGGGALGGGFSSATGGGAPLQGFSQGPAPFMGDPSQQGLNRGPTFGSFSGGKQPPIQRGPNPAAMMQSQGGQQWGQLASALAQQGGPQGISGGIRRFANTGLQSSADPYGAPRRAMTGVRGGKFSGPRG